MPAPRVLLWAKYLPLFHRGNNVWLEKITAVKAATSLTQSFIVKAGEI